MSDPLGAFALLCFSSLLAIINPLSAIPVFLGMTASYSPDHRRHTLLRAVLDGAGITSVSVEVVAPYLTRGDLVRVLGNYTGGGQFFADYNAVAATADQFNIGGTATGNTNVRLTRIGAQAYVPGGFLPVVTVTPGAPASTFTSDTPFATTGFGGVS